MHWARVPRDDERAAAEECREVTDAERRRNDDGVMNVTAETGRLAPMPRAGEQDDSDPGPALDILDQREQLRARPVLVAACTDDDAHGGAAGLRSEEAHV